MTHPASNRELLTWDGASLVVALVEQRIRPRYSSSGVASLNQVERVLLIVFEMDNEICNGGFNQWLFHVPGDMIAMTPACLRDIGAEVVASLVLRVLAEFGEAGPSADYWIREQQIFAMPESANQIFREADRAFQGLEQDMLRRLYQFARANLAEVRFG